MDVPVLSLMLMNSGIWHIASKTPALYIHLHLKYILPLYEQHRWLWFWSLIKTPGFNLSLVNSV